MATFAYLLSPSSTSFSNLLTSPRKSTFSAITYAAHRPIYSPSLYNTVLKYHQGPSSTLLDLGCGHGLISRSLAPHFTRVIATDPSPSMLAQAKKQTDEEAKDEGGRIELRQASAEDLGWLADGSVDMVVAGQAAHWFDYSKVWPELARKVRKGGTLALWGYKDNVFPDHPRATKVLDEYCYGDSKMGPFWEQPGRSILRDLYRNIKPPVDEWEGVERVEYEPGTEGKGSGEGESLMHKKMKLGEVEGYVRTFSAFHNWAREHPEEKSRAGGGEGDIVDRMFEGMLEVEPGWREKGEDWKEVEVENEWGSVVLMARRR